MMNRRSFFALLSGLSAVAITLVAAIPGIGNLLAPILHTSKKTEPDSDGGIRKRLCELDELTPGVPAEFAIVHDRQDAWTHYPEEQVGRVWLIRKKAETEAKSAPNVQAFSAICPHVGCTIGYLAAKDQFECPCHKAGFEIDGALIPKCSDGSPNPSLRGLDTLKCELVEDAETKKKWVEVVYERFVLGRADKRVES